MDTNLVIGGFVLLLGLTGYVGIWTSNLRRARQHRSRS
jgi:hypothetical protein